MVRYVESDPLYEEIKNGNERFEVTLLSHASRVQMGTQACLLVDPFRERLLQELSWFLAGDLAVSVHNSQQVRVLIRQSVCIGPYWMKNRKMGKTDNNNSVRRK